MKILTLEDALHRIRVLELEKAEAALRAKRLAVELGYLQERYKRLREEQNEE